jgi:hypothetical protein
MWSLITSGVPATEALLAAITTHEFAASACETRLLQSRGIRSTYYPTSCRRASQHGSYHYGHRRNPPLEVLATALRQVFDQAARGALQMDTEQVPLTDIESAWNRRTSSRRLVLFRP